MGIYFIACDTLHAVKLGYAADVASKASMCRSHCPAPVRLAACDMQGDPLTEAELLHRFRQDKIHGEWVALSAGVRSVMEATAVSGRVPGGWYLPNFTGSMTTYDFDLAKIARAFGITESRIVDAEGVRFPSWRKGGHFGCKLVPYLVAHLNALGHRVAYSDLIAVSRREEPPWANEWHARWVAERVARIKGGRKPAIEPA